MALQLGATFVARTFSGDKAQLVPLIKAAIEHEGAAFIDVISPCVAFNNHAGSTKSFDYVREHNEAVNRLDFITGRGADHRRLRAGRGRGGRAARRLASCALRKLAADYDAHDRLGAHELPAAARRPRGRSSPACSMSTASPRTCTDNLNTVDAPLNALSEKELCPGSAALDKINASAALKHRAVSRIVSPHCRLSSVPQISRSEPSAGAECELAAGTTQ